MPGDIKVDVNKETIDAATSALAAVYQEVIKDENSAVYNASDKKVQFFCYNDNDFTHIVSARKPVAAPGYVALLNKGALGWGPTIQVRVDDKEDQTYDIKRQSFYIWTGEGFREVDKKDIEAKENANA